MRCQSVVFAVVGALVGWSAPGAFGEDKPAAVKEQPATTTYRIKIPNSVVEFTLVKLPVGKVTIKDKDGKDVEVEVKPVWIGRTEVTWDEYDVYWEILDLPDVPEKEKKGMRTDKGVILSRPSAPYSPPDRGWGRSGSPAGSLFCREAREYCKWLSKMTGHKYRLPTEAEWEYACRAGGPATKLPAAELKAVAWYSANSDDQTHPVAKKKPNAWGLYDTLGNVAEWVTMLDGSEAVAGGSYAEDAPDVHPGQREAYENKKWQRNDPNIPQGLSWLSDGGFVGFRVVREE
ncbi:MAG TPA: SUMF1/EgtB/PvdO family nonheme iron enzyme, partial [Tepidisphaeraceae bacterium]|nr:SUMF1/EgtB/PvdO family nonheme iron enzyme [Tepidisphaeraceae bacterium]